LLESRNAEISALSTDADAKAKAIDDEKNAEIARLQKEIEKLKIQAEAYIGLIKST
jgi:phage host-nuclease inhibitor protein Gam